MTTDDIRRYYWAEPFQPFEFVLYDGRRVPVRARNHVSLSPTGQRVAVAETIEAFELIDIDDVFELRPLTPSPTAGAA